MPAPPRVFRPPGPALLAAIAVANVALWLAARPDGESTGRFAGELFGVEAVLLLSCALVLATLLPAVERAFDGLDRVAVWHRRCAVAGVSLLAGHLALVTSPPDSRATSLGNGLGVVALAGLLVLSLWALAPRLRAARWPGPLQRLARASYECWLTAHRLTGLFVGIAVIHATIVDPVLHRSALLRIEFAAIGVAGMAAYVYRELIARRIVPIHDYEEVADVRRLNETTLDVGLDPVGAKLAFAPGQFIFVAFGGAGGWQRHPFSVSSAPSDRLLGVTIKAVGDYTRELFEQLRPGVPARLAGPFGAFDYRRGGRDQVWIAGGIGITPFLSWIRSLDGDFDREVDFFYTVAHPGEAIHTDEIRAAADAHPSLRPHVLSSDTDGRLRAEDVLRGDRAPWIYMCGPPPMTRALAKGFRHLGVPADRVRWEDFGVR
jgi:predicted ferric reductase